MNQPTLFGPPGRALDRTLALAHLTAQDPALGALIARVGPCTLAPAGRLSPFGYLLRAIVHQQLSGRAAATIMDRVLALFPRRVAAPEALLACAPETLRAAGLSAAKTLAVRDLAAKTLEGTVPPLRRLQRMPSEEIVDRLTAVRGVGRWTVEMLLMFYLGRPDLLPVDDLGIRKGFAKSFGRVRRTDRFGLPHPDIILRRGERWRPYRTVASWYLWRALE